jgi:hypothetical protein
MANQRDLSTLKASKSEHGDTFAVLNEECQSPYARETEQATGGQSKSRDSLQRVLASEEKEVLSGRRATLHKRSCIQHILSKLLFQPDGEGAVCTREGRASTNTLRRGGGGPCP